MTTFQDCDDIVVSPNATVFDNGAIDVLNGGSGMDWFFANLSQDLLAKVSSKRWA